MMTIPKTINPESSTIDSALWEFRTARYTIALFALDEDMHPSQSFTDERDIAFACDGDPAHWFCAAVAVYDSEGDEIATDYLGGCSYGSFREFYSAHRWQYSRRQRRWITDPKSRAWKACERLRPRRANGTRVAGSYFTDMVREAIREARLHVAHESEGARRA